MTITQTTTGTMTMTQTTTGTLTMTMTQTTTGTLTMTMTPTLTITPYVLAEGEVVAYPSPARGNSVWFYYHCDTDAKVKIEICNVVGEKCAELANEHTGSGYFRTQWPIASVAPGIYLYRVTLETAGGKQILGNGWRKVAVVKEK
jgi:hypothetical protein